MPRQSTRRAPGYTTDTRGQQKLESTHADRALEAPLFESDKPRSTPWINWYLAGSVILAGSGLLALLHSIGGLSLFGFSETFATTLVPLLALVFMGVATYSIFKPPPRSKKIHPYRESTKKPRQRLVRPRKKRWFFGVCRGISRTTKIPVGFLRLVFFATTFLYFSGPICYILLATLLPGEPRPLKKSAKAHA